jgi:hypothetical protein
MQLLERSGAGCSCCGAWLCCVTSAELRICVPSWLVVMGAALF